MIIAVAVFGLLIGSFLNVVIYRVPLGLSLVSPGSACPACDHPVRYFDNVPVVSWLALRGKCRDCAHPIAARDPVVELATALLFLVAAWRIGLTPYLGAVLVLAGAGIALALIDLEHHRLPFSVTATATAATVPFLVADVLRNGGGHIGPSLVSAAVWALVYGGVWFVTAGRGMGLGDVALAPLLGLTLGWLGWGASLTGLLGGFVLGAIVGVILMATGRVGRRSRVPHGPFMLAGAAAGLFVGQPLWHAYLSLVGMG